jgi:hypothetical protein
MATLALGPQDGLSPCETFSLSPADRKMGFAVLNLSYELFLSSFRGAEPTGPREARPDDRLRERTRNDGLARRMG